MSNKYLRPISLVDGKADVYAVLDAFEVKSHAIGHAVKKLLCAGKRGHKDYATDLREAVDAIQRELAEQKPTQFNCPPLCSACCTLHHIGQPCAFLRREVADGPDSAIPYPREKSEAGQ